MLPSRRPVFSRTAGRVINRRSCMHAWTAGGRLAAVSARLAYSLRVPIFMVCVCVRVHV